MGKILIIKGADFSEVAVGTVVIPVVPTGSPVITISSTGSVTIACEGATNIYYTIDGNIPTKSSTKYTSPFTVVDRTTVKAIAEFSNGSVSNVSSSTYYAGSNRYITVVAEPTNGGTVSGAGEYPIGTKVTLTATPNDGYRFKQWSDGVTDATRTITVGEDVTYTAIFEDIVKNVGVAANPTEGGTVTGGGFYPIGTEITITATPNNGYSFSRWNDGNTDNPRSITVEDNITYTAIFELQKGRINVSISPEEGGTVSGAGEYPIGTEVTLTATPNAGYEFKHWDLSNTTVEEPTLKVVAAEDDKNIVAVFIEEGTANTVTITAQANPEEGGTISGAGDYQIGEEVTLTATPNPGYAFNFWLINSFTPDDWTLEDDYNPTKVFTANEDTAGDNQAGFIKVKTTYTIDELSDELIPDYIVGIAYPDLGLLPGDAYQPSPSSGNFTTAEHVLIPVEGYNRIRLKGTYPGCILACYNKAWESHDNCIKVYLNSSNTDDYLAYQYYDNLELELPSGTSWVGINYPVYGYENEGDLPNRDQEVTLFNV